MTYLHTLVQAKAIAHHLCTHLGNRKCSCYFHSCTWLQLGSHEGHYIHQYLIVYLKIHSQLILDRNVLVLNYFA